MSVADRHAAALARTVETYASAPVPADDLPGLSTDALDAARTSAADALEAARSRHDELVVARDAAERERVAAAAELDELTDAARAASDRRHELEAAADAAHERLIELAESEAEVSRLAEQSGRRVADLEQLHGRLEEIATSLLGHAVAPEESSAAAEALEELARAAGDTEHSAVSSAARDWAGALRDGTAPLDAAAAPLIEQIEEADRDWEASGAGDPLAHPRVIEVQASLDDARTAIAEIDAHATAGGLGQRTKAMIDAAHARRTALESQGRKADPEQLRSAMDDETEALRHVGFDSILDYRIAMSTGGAGALAQARRSTAQARVAELETALAATLRDAVAGHDALRARRSELRSTAERLVGGGASDPMAALHGLLALPEPVESALAQLDGLTRTAAADEARHREQSADLERERAELTRRRADDLARAVEEVAAAETAEQQAGGVRSRIEAVAATVEDLEGRIGEAARELASARDEVALLAQRHHLDGDVEALGHALLVAVRDQVASCSADDDTSEESTDPRAVIVDDTYDDLNDSELVAVFDPVLSADWAAPVVVVTSRPALVQHARRQHSRVTVVDARRRSPGRRRWPLRRGQGVLADR